MNVPIFVQELQTFQQLKRIRFYHWKSQTRWVFFYLLQNSLGDVFEDDVEFIFPPKGLFELDNILMLGVFQSFYFPQGNFSNDWILIAFFEFFDGYCLFVLLVDGLQNYTIGSHANNTLDLKFSHLINKIN